MNPVLATKAPLENVADSWFSNLSNLNICSQKGLIERFDSTIGASTVLMPFGGENQNTPTQAVITSYSIHYTKLYDAYV